RIPITVISMPYQQPMLFGEHPTPLHCPFCTQQVITSTERKHGKLAWLLFGGLCVLGCWCCSCCVLCADRFKDVEHSCPNCKRLLGHYRRI
ncbi:hypothetical protein PMAYCL1PPCAC_04303, partial [Pristionchus mayeri]